ncbi:MAG: YidH family protein [Nocardioides sp.]
MSDDDRRPRSVYGVGEDPDVRFSLANERTLLAWIRTALTLVAGAVALQTLDLIGAAWMRTTTVLMLLALSALISVGSYRHWAAVERAIRTGSKLPASANGLIMTATVVVMAAAVALAILI